jgi:hypothetical protein
MAKHGTRKTTKRGGKRITPGRGRVSASAAAEGQILAWMDDPMGAGPPITVAAPAMPGAPLATAIVGRQPAPALYAQKTPKFRYWTAAEVLRRAALFWAALLPSGQDWELGKTLPVKLDAGRDLNANYDRRRLNFYHERVDGTVYYSGESPDVVAHELGHAVLDAIKPQLWDTMSIEVAAFHEGFGDMSAMLSALQLQPFRQIVLAQTGGNINRSSSLSRLAEQLGYAIRKVSPNSAEPDCLRNAANGWIYRDPTQLPQSGPASQLTQEPHSFSRVFSGAFLDMLSGMLLAVSTKPTEGDLAQVSQDAARLLVRAVIGAPVVNRFYESVAKGLAAQAQSQFGGKYADTVRGAFVRRNILPATMAVATTSLQALATAGPAEPVMHSLPGSALGLPAETVHFLAPADAVTTARVGAGVPGDSARAFVERLIQRLHVDVGGTRMAMATHPSRVRRSHRLVRRRDGVFIERQFFDCGF